MKMNVILCEDVDNLGFMGEQVKVAAGYARNFLLPRKLAVVADSASAAQIEHEMRIIRKREDKRRVELAEVSKGMAKLSVEFVTKASAEGKLFGAVTTLHIAKKLAELGYDINRKKIKLPEPIKTLGDHPITLQLGAGVEATINVVVTAEFLEKEAQTDVGTDTDTDDDETDTMADAEATEVPAEGEATKTEAEAPAEEATEAPAE
jgi:large subunit ribosomal protein L9